MASGVKSTLAMIFEYLNIFLVSASADPAITRLHGRHGRTLGSENVSGQVASQVRQRLCFLGTMIVTRLLVALLFARWLALLVEADKFAHVVNCE